MTGLEALDTSIHKTNDWLNDVAQELGVEDRHIALSGLRAALHSLRDRLPPGDAAHLAAQLPIVVRGLFYEGYRPSETPKKARSREEYVAMLQQELSGRDELQKRPEEVARATFRTLERHVSPGETEKVRHSLPEAVRELWSATS